MCSVCVVSFVQGVGEVDLDASSRVSGLLSRVSLRLSSRLRRVSRRVFLGDSRHVSCHA